MLEFALAMFILLILVFIGGEIYIWNLKRKARKYLELIGPTLRAVLR